jgi:hypothetical protein
VGECPGIGFGQPDLIRDDGESEAQINFTIKGGNALPPNFRVTWKGTLVPADGEYWLYLPALGTHAGTSPPVAMLGRTRRTASSRCGGRGMKADSQQQICLLAKRVRRDDYQ